MHAALLVVETMLDRATVFAYSSPVVSVEILGGGTVCMRARFGVPCAFGAACVLHSALRETILRSSIAEKYCLPNREFNRRFEGYSGWACNSVRIPVLGRSVRVGGRLVGDVKGR